MGVFVREFTLKEGGLSFRIDIYHKGQRRQVNTGFQSERPNGREYQKARRLAEAKAAEYEAQLQADPDALFKKEVKYCSDFVEYFDGIATERSIFKSTLKHLKDFTKGKPLPMENVSQAWAEQFRAYLDGLPLSGTTKFNYLTGFKIILNKAANEGLIPDFSRRLRPFKKADVPLKYLTIDQIKRLDATPCRYPIMRIAFLFACFTGLRISDLRALRDADIQHNGERLEIRYRMQKTKKHQVLVLGAQAVRYLQEAQAAHQFRLGNIDKVFSLPSETTYSDVLTLWGEAAGIPFHLTSHCARHTFAVLSLQSGVDLYTLSKLLGHADIATTQIYAKVADSMKTAAMDRLPTL